MAIAALSLLPGINLTSWIPWPYFPCQTRILQYVIKTYVRNGNGGNNGAGFEIPEAKSVSLLNAGGRLKDRQGHDKVRGEDDVLVKVDAQAVRGELLSKNVESALNILGPLVDNVARGVGLDQTAWRSANSTAHISDEKTTIA